jgi:hypothetical protein
MKSRTSIITTVLKPTTASSPIVISPYILAPAKLTTSSHILGFPMFLGS